LTGQLGDVMKESAQAAVSLAKMRMDKLGVEPSVLEKNDLHIHFPAGAIPKDGPSAGVTIFTALTSLLTGIRVRGDVAMTGEATLRGLVLPVGGIKEKVLAAHRAGIKRIIMPERNKKDLNDVPEQAKKEMEFVFAHSMDDVLRSALEEDPFEKAAKNPPPSDGEKAQAQEQQAPGASPQAHA
jgi:ATP-dependent Lon protease